MSKQRLTKSVPPVDQVRRELTAATAEVRFLRKMLKLAKDAEQAKSLREQALSLSNQKREVKP